MEVIGIGTCAFRSTVDVSTKGIGQVNPWSQVGTSYSDIRAMGASQSRRIRSPVISLIGLVLPTSPKPILACKAGHRTRDNKIPVHYINSRIVHHYRAQRIRYFTIWGQEQGPEHKPHPH